VHCPSCAAADSRVVDSREAEGGSAIRRRRECLACGHRFSTVERALHPVLVVEKRSGEREQFSLDKVVAGVSAACKNRPVHDADIDRLARGVESRFRDAGGAVTTQQLGLAVLDGLRTLDHVAYLRFASVYKGFEDADDFAREAVLLTKATAPKVHEPSRRS
jgi:transcriptional repressor NrdR